MENNTIAFSFNQYVPEVQGQCTLHVSEQDVIEYCGRPWQELDADEQAEVRFAFQYTDPFADA